VLLVLLVLFPIIYSEENSI